MSWERPGRWLEWSWLGRVGYEEATSLQERVREEVAAGETDRLLLLEHPPVYTLGRNAERSDIVAGSEWLRRHRIEVHDTDRGGRVTYHGPGQLVGYPIFDLSLDRRDVRHYVRTLLDGLVATVAEHGVRGVARGGQPEIGIWVGEAKLASVGVHIKRWVTTHGFALNLTTDLSHFAGIVPCGLAGVSMVSVESLTGRRLDLETTAASAARHIGRAFGYENVEEGASLRVEAARGA